MSDNYYRFFPGDYHRDTGDLTLDKSQDLGYMYRQEVKPMSSAETQKQFQIYKWVHKELHSYNVVRSRTSVFVYPLLHLRCYDAVV